MFELVKSQTIFLDSRRRRGADAAYCYTVSFTADAANCAEDEVFRLTLKGLTTQLSWGYITALSCSFTVNENGLPRTVTISPGNYSCKGLAQAITAAYFAFDSSAMDYSRFRCTWSSVTNKLTFASPAGKVLSLAFPSQAAAETYGLKSASPGVLTSQAVLNPMAYNSLYISVAGIRPRLTYNLANIHSELVGRTWRSCPWIAPSRSTPYCSGPTPATPSACTLQSAHLTRCRSRSPTGRATPSLQCRTTPSQCNWTPSAALTLKAARG
jgi:hypothetical protein